MDYLISSYYYTIQYIYIYSIHRLGVTQTTFKQRVGLNITCRFLYTYERLPSPTQQRRGTYHSTLTLILCYTTLTVISILLEFHYETLNRVVKFKSLVLLSVYCLYI